LTGKRSILHSDFSFWPQIPYHVSANNTHAKTPPAPLSTLLKNSGSAMHVNPVHCKILDTPMNNANPFRLEDDYVS